MSLWNKHAIFEKNSIILVVGILVMVAIGGIVEIAPLFYLKSTIEKVEGIRPYTPLELAGRAIYVREGCYNCHSQMVRPLRDEVERYGHYSLAVESLFDRPFQWGSKRTGPDLARVGGKYSDEWQRAHLANPRSIVPDSIMPGYPFLEKNELNLTHIADLLRAHKHAGTPYTDEMLQNALSDAKAQASPEDAAVSGLQARYAKTNVRDFDGNPNVVSEADALIAYLQMMGTLVDFKAYNTKANIR